MRELAYSLVCLAFVTSTTAYGQNADPPKSDATPATANSPSADAPKSNGANPVIPDLKELLKGQPKVTADLNTEYFRLLEQKKNAEAALKALDEAPKGKDTKGPEAAGATQGDALSAGPVPASTSPGVQPASTPARPAVEPVSPRPPSESDRPFLLVKRADIDDELAQFQRAHPGFQLIPSLQAVVADFGKAPTNTPVSTHDIALPPSHNHHIFENFNSEAYRQAEAIKGVYKEGAKSGLVLDPSDDKYEKGQRSFDGAARAGARVGDTETNPTPVFQIDVRPKLGETPPEVLNSVPVEKALITKDGGVRITATAEIPAIDPAAAAWAAYDEASGMLTLALRSGQLVKCRLDRDDFAVAVRCAYEKKVDPCLSMDLSPKTPGFNAVVYSGPLASTHFGKVMFDAGQRLGSIMFNREGDFRGQLSQLIPGIDPLMLEAHNTGLGSTRVNLRAEGARFAVSNGEILPAQVRLRLEVEGIAGDSEYYQESLHRLARAINDNMDSLVATYAEFGDFCRLVDHVALAKWLERNQIAFNWNALRLAPKEEFRFKGLSDEVTWRRAIAGSNLDGWDLNLPSDAIETSRESGRITLNPKGNRVLEVLRSTASRNYAVLFGASTDGPVEFILRQAKNEPETSLTIDTKGRLQLIELYVVGNKWSVYLRDADPKEGVIKVSAADLKKPKTFNRYGVRVPIGSKISLLTAAVKESPGPEIQLDPVESKPQPVGFEGIGTYRSPSKVEAVAITPDARRAFVGLDDGQILDCDLASRKATAIDFRFYKPITSLAMNAQGDHLAVGASEAYIALFDLANLKQRPKANRFPKKTSKDTIYRIPTALAYSPAQGEIVCALDDGSLLRLSATDLRTIQEVPPPEGYSIRALALSPQGPVAASFAKFDKKGQSTGAFVRTFSIADLQAISAIMLAPINSDPAAEPKATPFSVDALAFDPSGTYLAAGCSDGNVKVLQASNLAVLQDYVSSCGRRQRQLVGLGSELACVQDNRKLHESKVATVAFAPDGQMVTGGHDALCQFWTNIFQVGQAYLTYRGTINCSKISADGNWLVRGGRALDIVQMNQPEKDGRVAEFGGTILGLAISADRKRLVTGGLDKRVIFWNRGEPISTKMTKLEDSVTGVDFVEGEASIAACLGNGSITVLSASDLSPVRAWRAHAGRAVSVARIGNKLASIGDDGMVRIWTNEGSRFRSRNLKSPCTSLAVSGERFAVGTRDGSIAIQSLADSTENVVIHGRPQSITALAFSDNGKQLTVGYFDGSLEAFDSTSGQLRGFQQGEGASVLAFAVHPARPLILAGYRYGITRILNAASLRETAGFKVESAREILGLQWALDDATFASAGADNALTFIKIKGNLDDLTR